MEILNLQQGTQEWHQARANKFTASEAPAMMGKSKYMSRDELIHQKKTGEVKEVSPAQQRIFDKGHATEESARPIAEGIIGSELYPATGVDGDYLASFDGLTMFRDAAFEHKLLNQGLVADVEANDLDPHYYWQLEHQLMVSNAEKVLFVTSDGTEENFYHCWYESIPERREQLIAGWAQFAKDLEAYEPVSAKAKAEAAPIESLPAINYELNGLALTSNLDIYRSAAEKLVEDSKKPLESDQDFADREALVKEFKKAEGKIKLVQEQVVGEIQDVDAFCKDLGYIGELIRQARLTGEKAVKSRKDEIKRDIVSSAQNDLQQVISGFNESLTPHGVQMPLIAADFQTAIKGKKTVKSLQEAANDDLARAKIEATDIALVINTNLSEYIKLAEGFEFLFADLQQLITSPEEAFTAMVKARISDHKEREAQRLADEEAARLAKEAEQEKQDQPSPSLDEVLEAAAPEEIAQAVSSGEGSSNMPILDDDFDIWWHNIGSGMFKGNKEDLEEFVCRVARAAFEASK